MNNLIPMPTEDKTKRPNDDPSAKSGKSLIGELKRLRRVVEVYHDRRLQRIETDLRWVIMLTSAQLMALVGGAIATFTL